MEDAKIGATFRAVRIRHGRTQQEIADAAGVTQTLVSRLERGQLPSLTFAGVRRVAAALEMWLEIMPRWRGVELDRLIDSAHGALQRSVLARFEGLGGWIAVPEVSYSIYGERGAIDILAWHPETRTLPIIELKTMLVDPAELVRTADRRQRLAAAIASERGWRPRAVGRWVDLHRYPHQQTSRGGARHHPCDPRQSEWCSRHGVVAEAQRPDLRALVLAGASRHRPEAHRSTTRPRLARRRIQRLRTDRRPSIGRAGHPVLW